MLMIIMPLQLDGCGGRFMHAKYANGILRTAIHDIYREPFLIIDAGTALAASEYGQCISQGLQSQYNNTQLLQSTKAKHLRTTAISLAQDHNFPVYELGYLRRHH